MHSDHAITEDRLARALRRRIRPAARTTVGRLDVTAWHLPGEPIPAADALASESRAHFRSFRIGDSWGPAWGTTWFHVTGTAPPSEGRRVELMIDLGWGDTSAPGFQAEGLVFTPDGRAVKGLNPRNQWVPVLSASIDFFVEAAANPLIFDPDDRTFAATPLGEKSTAGAEPLYRLARADITVVDDTMCELASDLEFLGELSSTLADTDPRRWSILTGIDRALNILDPDAAARAAEARDVLRPLLAAPANASAHRVSAVGHAHIDSAWLWPARETIRKVARTVANVLGLMESHLELTFVMSSAQQWLWLRDHHPDLFERARERVAEGRFVPVGGMWVESDTNMVGGEAMVRQLLFGQRFFTEELGIRSRVVWLPDSFGYSAALPQIVRLAGFDYFLTQKISWNQTNAFPHHSFDWVGIDGTTVFTHFPAADTYNGDISPRELAYTSANFREKGRASRSLIPFGYGDGGGGPVREMLDRARRAKDVEGLPKVTIESPEAFFDAARAEYDPAPQWYGELYLELHRGTYTTQAPMKHGNRRCEQLLREAELWATTAAVRGVAEYPYERLADAWRSVLLLQFHDILPGTSIAWVHREAREQYARISAELGALIETSQQALAGEGAVALSFNSLPFSSYGVPTAGAAPPSVSDVATTVTEEDGAIRLTGDRVRVTVSAEGLITSVIDTETGLEAIAPGTSGNLLQWHPDHPVRWDAWDIDEYYRENVTDIRNVDDLTVVRGDRGEIGVSVTRSFGASTATQTITIRPGSKEVTLRTQVDWHEDERILKLAFALNVHADRARFETQFGHAARPIHENTSWDVARFEVSAHRFVHVGEPVGVALANDSTYGHEVRRVARAGGGMATVVRESLLRAPKYPDPDTDHGTHEFTHVLVPAATVRDAVVAGYAVNTSERRLLGSGPVPPLVALDGDPSVILDTVKLAEDGSGDVILRVYEAEGREGRAEIVPDFRIADVTETDLLERPIESLSLKRDAALSGTTVTLRPFQIATLRLRR